MKRIKAPIERLRDEDYRQLWRVVDGAITDCVIHHPEYFRDTGMIAVRQSIIKRVVGSLLGYAKQRGRSGEEPAAKAE